MSDANEGLREEKTGVVVEEAILHILDPHGERGLLLSWRPLPQDVDARIFEYFEGHIARSIAHRNARKARFETIEDGRPSGVCKSLHLAGGMDLVAGSQQLAQELYRIMEGDSRIATGDLIVCRCRVVAGAGAGDDGRRLAIMKVDPTEGYPQHTDDRGHQTYVTFDVDRKVEVLPTAPDSVQKFALVRPLEPRPDHDMVLFDRQFRPTPKQAIAGFFAERFLGAEEVPEAPQKTAQLYDLVLAAQNRSRPELEPEESEALHDDLQDLLERPTVRIGDIEAVDMPAAVREELVAKVKKAFPEGEVEPSRPDLDRLRKVRTFKGSRESGLKVSVYDQFYDRVVQSVRYLAREDGDGYYEVVLHTDSWDEVS